MPSRSVVLAFSVLLAQTLPIMAHPAANGIWEGSNGVGNTGNINAADFEDEDIALYSGYDVSHWPKGGSGGNPGGHCGGGYEWGPGGPPGIGGGSPGGGGGPPAGGGPLSTITVSDCTTTVPTTTVTVTIDDDGIGSATVTETLTACTATITNDGDSCIATDTVTNTITDTVTENIIFTSTDCIATITDLTTITRDGPTVTDTITTPGPTVTSTVTQGASTVTEAGSTETDTVTETVIQTSTDTITHNQIITDIHTTTETETEQLITTETTTEQLTTTVSANDCTPTGNGGLDYGTCTDPTIVWEYGLDGRNEYSYTTHNKADFPYGSSPSIDGPAGLICNRLRSPCNAPQETIDRCSEAQRAVASLTGKEAADVWNFMMT